MTALSKIREAGFDVAVIDDKLSINPASALTPNQREFLKSNKAEIIEQLLLEQSTAKVIAIRKPVHGETDSDFLDRVLDETLSNTHHTKAITCKSCSNFLSHHKHGGGSGSSLVGVPPYGACHWYDTIHECGSFIPVK